ncbi:MAG TPA: hypothetical protein VMU54_25780 [Planctomycetota bacterium]|nr:hypothetical protein [Planctomycetota bacterium]
MNADFLPTATKPFGVHASCWKSPASATAWRCHSRPSFEVITSPSAPTATKRPAPKARPLTTGRSVWK